MFTPAPALVLDVTQRQALESLARTGATPQSVARKCQVILLASQGVSNNQIAEHTGLSRPTVIATRAAFTRQGMNAIGRRQTRQRSRRVQTPELEQTILDITLNLNYAQLGRAQPVNEMSWAVSCADVD
jgi:DNA-binding CsgD family transcriptional regulator